ncbi:GTP-binding protein [Marchantia polymorpha subsp. ruderalis]|uniref:EngB-type G domain-containing protein n=2 Tax=Marchantia polymorpha TaxID=3197 RepID=A0AAF6B731_MARPO|nr:hypothetical protein MARPO_0125s0002 [Marchantia polymorpha]BBN07815.1 hypothetical protein Mp_4g06570 [Marchantia polymorpha subsp. ruderalis]|eukprot:PTQ30349.1 hypothetical protein MARPO_0125s0002 [Marchantia polymorpha]
MQGYTSRVCSSALQCLITACELGEASNVIRSLRACNSRVRERVGRASGILERHWGADPVVSSKIGSSNSWHAGIIAGPGNWHSNFPVSYYDTTGSIIQRCIDSGIPPPLGGGSLFLPRTFASSPFNGVASRPQKSFGSRSRFKPEGKSRLKLQSKSQFKSKNAEEPPRSKRFSGALSSIKDLHSEHARGNSKTGKGRSKTTLRSPRKRVTPSVRSARQAGQTIGIEQGAKPRLSRKLKTEERPNDDGERIKRRRKRIRPRPNDITFKRGLNSCTPDIGVPSPVAVQKAAQEAPLSTNAKFRQIEPSRELLRQIEENLLGRRRLVEWRRSGFDPTRTAPLDDVPESKDRRAPIQETVFRQKLTFIAAAKIASSLPTTQLTEIAFAGRSNVGKSSLINALTRQWGVARTSDKPGLTQSINFFTLGTQLCLVDLPGYGFAYAKVQIKEDWEQLVKEYVASRPNLKRVCLLVDAKWGLKPRDEELLQLMESSRTRYQIILTKTDVLPPLDLARRATQILQTLKNHKCLVQPLMMVSSKSGAGVPHLRASLARVVSGQSRVLQEDSV